MLYGTYIIKKAFVYAFALLGCYAAYVDVLLSTFRSKFYSQKCETATCIAAVGTDSPNICLFRYFEYPIKLDCVILDKNVRLDKVQFNTFLDYPDLFLDYPDWGLSMLFLSRKSNARVKLAKSGQGPHLFRIIVFCVVLFIVLCYCLYALLLLLCCAVIVLLCYYLCYPMYWSCVLYHCHRVLTQLQLTNISIYI